MPRRWEIIAISCCEYSWEKVRYCRCPTKSQCDGKPNERYLLPPLYSIQSTHIEPSLPSIVIAGGGYENIQHYEDCVLVWANVPNIHAMYDSWYKLFQLLNRHNHPQSSNGSSINGTNNGSNITPGNVNHPASSWGSHPGHQNTIDDLHWLSSLEATGWMSVSIRLDTYVFLFCSNYLSSISVLMCSFLVIACTPSPEYWM